MAPPAPPLRRPLAAGQWRTHGGVSGVNPPPLKILKEMKTSLFGTNLLFHTEIAEIALMFFYPIQLGYKISKNFHCDAIIGLPKVTFSGALRLTLTIAETKKPFFFETNRLFFMRSLPKRLSCFSVRSNQ